MDEAHREVLPLMHARAAEHVEELHERGTVRQLHTERNLARRGFLLGVGGVGAMAALAACSSAGTQTPDTRAGTASGGSYTGDLKVVALAVALENQAVAAYKAALANAKAGTLGTVPPAAATFMQTAMSQHEDHAKAWNAVLTGAGLAAITGIPLSNAAATANAVNSATSTAAVAKLALGLENQATETYLYAIGNVSNSGAIATAASIAPVEAMHAATLNFVLGQYPVPDSFISTSKAASPSMLTV
ncbi:ferritin-like domain-containing protein [Actinospica durhamensis]|uniref:Ferritin-like domain-containing protein n=2 Tax=Actinospica durhamensis TaxID=1508375 RepID=A0A941ET68_9ACTN|nr:ferritin-like domain-containing protein [Actinospica durhamensis]